MKRTLKTMWAMLVIFGVVTFLTVGCNDDTVEVGSTTPTLTVGTPTLSATTATAGESKDITVEVAVTGAGSAVADSVVISGDSLSSAVSMTEGDSSWSGTITVNQSVAATLSFTITASDSTNDVSATGTFTVTVSEAGSIAAYVSKFITSADNPDVASGDAWFDVTINDISALGSEWYIKYGSYKYLNTAISSSNISASIADGDIIRIHSNNWTGTADTTVKGDDSRWDFESENKYVNDGDTYGMFFIQTGSGDPSSSNVISILPFNDSIDNASKKYWFSDDVATLFTSLVSAGLWLADDSTSCSSGVQINGDTDVCSCDSVATAKGDVTVSSYVVVSVAETSSTVKAGGSNTFTISRTGSTTSALTVSAKLSGTATKDTDYTCSDVSSDTVTIDAGSSSATVTIAAESGADSDETIILTVSDGSGYKASPGSNSATMIVSVYTTVFSDDFSTDLSKWTATSVTGDQEWTYKSSYGIDSSGCAYMSGYNSGTSYDNEDWLITSVDLTSYSNAAKLTLYANLYGSYGGGDDLTVLVSTSYDGTSTPTDSAFTDLSVTLPSTTKTYTEVSADLSTYIGNTVYIALKYVSETSGTDTWEIDNVVVGAK
ncbi:MAG: choice-of-anchor J domain-containing protein [Spirochaetales bacterium]|nr:choice-of-anchor J domain-containing protein [Spirochaetales bacterium]